MIVAEAAPESRRTRGGRGGRGRGPKRAFRDRHGTPRAAKKKKQEEQTVQLHAECFLAYKSTIPSERCGLCGSCLWTVVRGDEAAGSEDRFSRRASILTREDGTEESLCDVCAKEYA